MSDKITKSHQSNANRFVRDLVDTVTRRNIAEITLDYEQTLKSAATPPNRSNDSCKSSLTASSMDSPARMQYKEAKAEARNYIENLEERIV